MALIIEWTKKQREDWDKWIATCPSIIQELCKKFPPNKLYKLKSSGHRVTIYSYSEDKTITVIVSGEYNAVIFDRQIFGIPPDDLEECGLPLETEPLGTLLAEKKDINAFIERYRGKPK